MRKVTILLMLITVFSKILGFLRETILASYFGSSAISDAFIYSLTLPNSIFMVITAAFATGFIPMFARIENERNDVEAKLFLNNTLNVMCFLGLIISFFVFIFVEWTLKILLPNASVAQLIYLVPFVRITIFSIMFTCVIQLMTGFLQVNGHFVIPAMMGFPLNIILIFGIVFSQKTNVYLLPIFILIAYIAQALLLLFFAYRRGYRFKFVFNLKDEHIQRMLRLSVPLILGSATTLVGNLISQGLASGVIGGVSYINYATKIGGMVEGIFGVAIISVMYPSLSKMIANSQLKQAVDEVGTSVVSMLVFVLPCAVGLLVLANPILQFVYMRNKFTYENVLVLEPIFRNYCLGILFSCVYSLFVKVFYAFQDTKTPIISMMIFVVTQSILGIILTKQMGVAGISLAMSIAYIVAMISLCYLLYRRNLLNNGFSRYYIQIFKCFCCSLLMGVFTFVIYNFFNSILGSGSRISLLLTILLSVIVYLVFILMARIETIQLMTKSIFKKFKKKH